MALPFVDPQQLSLLPEDPQIGERWANIYTGTICTVLALNQRHYNWVTVRINEAEQIIPIANFLRTFRRFHNPPREAA